MKTVWIISGECSSKQWAFSVTRSLVCKLWEYVMHYQVAKLKIANFTVNDFLDWNSSSIYHLLPCNFFLSSLYVKVITMNLSHVLKPLLHWLTISHSHTAPTSRVLREKHMERNIFVTSLDASSFPIQWFVK